MQYNWLDHWEKNDIAFHLATVNPLLISHWPQLKIKKNSNVLVPLCGKTLDILWLANQGHYVIGVELSEIACKSFFVENNLTFKVEKIDSFICYSNNQIKLYCGDFFELSRKLIPLIGGVYDRAALMALPDGLRQKYVIHLQELIGTAAQILLIVYDSPNAVQGPPYSLNNTEIKKLYKDWEVIMLERLKKTNFSKHLIAKGYRELEEVVYFLKHNSIL